MFDKKKQESYIKFCENLSPSQSITKIWKTIKGFKARALNPGNGNKDRNNLAQDAQLLEAFNKLSTVQGEQEEEIICHYDHVQDKVLTAEISMLELLNAITKAKKKSAPGLDDISYEIICYVYTSGSYRDLLVFVSKSQKSWLKLLCSPSLQRCHLWYFMMYKQSFVCGDGLSTLDWGTTRHNFAPDKGTVSNDPGSI